MKRGLAVSLALNGASCGSVCIVPLLLFLIAFLIAHFGFAHGLYLAVGTRLVILVPSVITILRRHPAVEKALVVSGSTSRYS
jgi:hypothetical protein